VLWLESFCLPARAILILATACVVVAGYFM
ncbi:MAG: hypothetical protein ACI89J_002581, partial [Hyphomicrobiaceae bacterium]